MAGATLSHNHRCIFFAALFGQAFSDFARRSEPTTPLAACAHRSICNAETVR
jgi:hypothetical protein